MPDGGSEEHVIAFLNTKTGEYTYVTLLELGVRLAPLVDRSLLGAYYPKFQLKRSDIIHIFQLHETYLNCLPPVNVQQFNLQKRVLEYASSILHRTTPDDESSLASTLPYSDTENSPRQGPRQGPHQESLVVEESH